MSDSCSDSRTVPPDAKLERYLRDAVRKVYRSGSLADLTVKRIRNAVENKLDLDEDFFKSHDRWKEKSKDVIQSEVNSQDYPSSQAQSSVPSGADREALPPPNNSKEERKPKYRGTKRNSSDTAEPKPRKKRKSLPDVVNSTSEKEQCPPKRKQKWTRVVTPPIGSDTEQGPPTKSGVDGPTDAGGKAADSESEMSVVLDKNPNIKKEKRHQKPDANLKASKSRISKPRKSSESPADPDAEEIKRLQGWLIKCGIRKMWYKELAPYDTQKAKIKHLKEMLADAGMTGRCSKEKAEQIREEREFKADLEAVQQGDRVWGKNEGEDAEENGEGKPRKRLARGLQGLDFLNDDDGEETD